MKNHSKPSRSGKKETDREKELFKLQEQRKRLRRENKQLKAERDQYKKSLLAMMAEDLPHIPINKKELLAMVGQQPPLRELLAEIRAKGA